MLVHGNIKRKLILDFIYHQKIATAFLYSSCGFSSFCMKMLTYIFNWYDCFCLLIFLILNDVNACGSLNGAIVFAATVDIFENGHKRCACRASHTRGK